MEPHPRGEEGGEGPRGPDCLGEGEHRADKFIIDFVRMAAYLGLADKLSVRTNDKDFRKTVERLVEDI